MEVHNKTLNADVVAIHDDAKVGERRIYLRLEILF